MRLAPGTPLALSLAFTADAPMLAAGTAVMARDLAQLEWSKDVIARRLPVGGLYYPPEPGLQAARGRQFDGLHGFLADSLPEGWGYRLMRKRLGKLGVDIATLTPIDRLALVGHHGRGALVFDPATRPPDDIATLDLDALAADASEIIAGEEGQFADTLAGLASGSGGARPKVHVGFDRSGGIWAGEGEVPPGCAAWLVKFRAPADPADIGPIEEAYALMAQAAGLDISPHRLIPARNGPGYFATRRFDRPADGARLHMMSLAGLIEASPQIPSTSYDMFLRATQALTRRRRDVDAAFCRVVFNVLACNRDDHTRQHAYLMGPDGDWRLAPAFDLTFSEGPGGEHYMDVEGEGRRPARAHVERLGAKHGLDVASVSAVIDEVGAAVADWPRFARTAGVTRSSTASVRKAHQRIWADFRPR